MPAGYSGTPLAKKLGIRESDTVTVLGEPEGFRGLLVDLPDGVTFRSRLSGAPDVVIAFETERRHLLRTLPRIEARIHPDRIAWIAWPKKTAGVATDLTGDVVRAAILDTSLVDVKVCAISEVWSGLQAVWRKDLRSQG